MADAATDNFSIRRLPFRDVPGFGPGHPFARLTEPQVQTELPLFDAHQAGGVPTTGSAGSPYLNRDRLADELAAFNAEAGHELDAATVRSIRGEGMFVIAGQQPGLLLGPVYTLLKAMTAIVLADRLRQSGVEAIPAFWIAGEDHDLDEVRSARIAGQTLKLDHAELHRPGPRPQIADVALTEWRGRIEQFAAHALAGLPHRDQAMDLLKSADASNYTTLLATMLGRLLGPHGLVLIDPTRLRALTGPPLADAIDRWPALQSALQSGGQHVRQLGFSPPLDRLNLFRIGEDRLRHRVDRPETLSGRDVRNEPERFSPGAALRPIVQDAALPTVATVVGPSELVYLWQIGPLYDALGLSRSMPHPRISATFLDEPTLRLAERIGLDEDALLRPPEQPQDEQADDDDLQQIEAEGQRLAECIEALIDDRNRKALGKAARSIRYQAGKATDRVRQQRLEQLGKGPRQLRQYREVVFPGGRPQERGMCALEWLARFGPNAIDDTIDYVQPTELHHLLLTTRGSHA